MGSRARIAYAASPRRIAALDWAGCEMLVALGVEPIAVADVSGFSHQFPHSVLPPGTIDLGARWEPNLELLRQLAPDAILVGGRGVFPIAERIAPPLVVELYDGKTPPLTAAARSLLELAQALALEARAEQCVSEMQLLFEKMRKRFVGQQKRVLVATLEPDGLNVVVHGRNGLIGNCLERVGLQNAWIDEENRWGFRKTGMEQLLRFPDAVVLVIGQGTRTDRALRLLANNDVWQMVMSNAGPVIRLPAFFPFGALPTARHFILSLETLIA
jgi:ABC-type Fe3+-hydroxamate transport system substrate-binding protein